MSTIYHITRRGEWERAQQVGEYRAGSLDTEGFMHNSTAPQVTRVANAIFRGRADLVLLCIDTERIRAPLRYDAVGAETFPHIYGPLNLDAVVKVAPFPPQADGSFTLPPEVRAG